jgi:hypothetical protein
MNDIVAEGEEEICLVITVNYTKNQLQDVQHLEIDSLSGRSL